MQFKKAREALKHFPKRHPWLTGIISIIVVLWLLAQWIQMRCPWFTEVCSMEEVEYVLEPRSEHNKQSPEWNNVKIRVPKAYVYGTSIEYGQLSGIKLVLRYPEMTPWNTTGTKQDERMHRLNLEVRLNLRNADAKKNAHPETFKKTGRVFDGMEDYTFNSVDPSNRYQADPHYFPALSHKTSLYYITCAPIIFGLDAVCRAHYSVPHIHLSNWRIYEAAVLKFLKEHSTIIPSPIGDSK